VRGLIVKTGGGKLSAQLRCVYAFAIESGFTGIVTIDGNNKDDPAAIARMVEELKHGADFVQGSRFIDGGFAENTPIIRHLAIKLIHAPLLRFFSGFHWTDTTQGFRAYSRALLTDPRIDVFRDVFQGYELLAYLSYRAPRLGCVADRLGERANPRGAALHRAAVLCHHYLDCVVAVHTILLRVLHKMPGYLPYHVTIALASTTTSPSSCF
jgi:hypothetical protein